MTTQGPVTLTFWEQIQQFGKAHLAYIIVAIVANIIGVIFHI